MTLAIFIAHYCVNDVLPGERENTGRKGWETRKGDSGD